MSAADFRLIVRVCVCVCVCVVCVRQRDKVVLELIIVEADDWYV